jgi:hypothetical protein
MFRVTKSTLTAGLLAVMLTPLAFDKEASAAELKPSHVPADAKWVMHIDYESFSDSGILQLFRERNPLLTSVARNWLVQQYGVDPPEDLKSVTMFGRDYQKYTGTVILRADYEAAKVEAKLKESPAHSTTQWQGHTLHEVAVARPREAMRGREPRGDQKITVAMLDGNTIVVGSSNANVQAAIKLLAGDAKSLEGQKSPLLTQSVGKAWFYGAAIELSKLRDQKDLLPIVAQHERITLAFGERGNKMFEEGEFVAQSEEVAKQMQRVLDGVVAFGKLQAHDSDSMKALYQNVNIKQEDKTTRFTWEGSPEQVRGALEELGNRLDAWKMFLTE